VSTIVNDDEQVQNEKLLMAIGKTRYIKAPTALKQTYPEWKNQNPIAVVTASDTKVTLTLVWNK